MYRIRGCKDSNGEGVMLCVEVLSIIHLRIDVLLLYMHFALNFNNGSIESLRIATGIIHGFTATRFDQRGKVALHS